MVFNPSFLTFIFYVTWLQIVGNVVFLRLDAENVSYSFLLEYPDILRSLEVRPHKDILSNIWNLQLIERILIIYFYVPIEVVRSKPVRTVISIFMDVNPAWIAFYLYFLPLTNEQVLETLPAFIHIKRKWVVSFIMASFIAFLIALGKSFLGIAQDLFLHLVIYLPSAHLADVAHDVVVLHKLCSLQAKD